MNTVIITNKNVITLEIYHNSRGISNFTEFLGVEMIAKDKYIAKIRYIR